MGQHASEGALEHSLEPVQSRELVERLLVSERYTDDERYLLSRLA